MLRVGWGGEGDLSGKFRTMKRHPVCLSHRLEGLESDMLFTPLRAQGRGPCGRHTVHALAPAAAHRVALPGGGPEAELQAAGSGGGRC